LDETKIFGEKSMKKILGKTLLAAAITGVLGLASTGAMAQVNFPDFQVTETSVSGANANVFTADKITGNYTEVITFSGNTFNVSLLWNAGQFVANNGSTTVPSQLGQTGALSSNQYGLYALYTGNGTFTSSGGVTTFNFAPGGSLQVYLDPNTNTTFNQPATGSSAWTTAGNGDDVLIATGVPRSGQGTLDPALSTCTGGGGSGINCGSFGATSSFALTASGSQYFTAPSPFYNVSFQSGQLNNFSPTGTQVINGSLDVVFGVPEPTSVALIGLGLMGLGLSRRRKQA
jgi:hypothetical protein